MADYLQNHPATAPVRSVEAAERAIRLMLAADSEEKVNKAHYVYIPRAFEGCIELQGLCHGLAARSGWWTSRLTGKPLDAGQVNIGEKLMLIVSEVSEAMEGHRKDLMDDKLPHRKMIEVELADALIRIFDLAGWMQLDLAGAVIEKLAFNQQREDHKIENRNAPGGKAY